MGPKGLEATISFITYILLILTNHINSKFPRLISDKLNLTDKGKNNGINF